eukprot:PLAT4698.1.p1 GENE.PLAT4698.1~~PLAT4698.1.p1  ORF type:complete len:928 (-),score=549.17 PLAT4698.1:190-2973(-)
MSWFRSSEMEYVSIVMQEDVAYKCVEELGRLGVVQFTDLNSEMTPFQRQYAGYIKRCDEMERRLRFFEEQLAKYKPYLGDSDVEPGDAHTFLNRLSVKSEEMMPGAVLEELETEFQEREAQLRELNTHIDSLTRSYNDNVELSYVLEAAGTFFEELDEQVVDERLGGGADVDDDGDRRGLLSADEEAGSYGKGSWGSIGGESKGDDEEADERSIFSSARGDKLFKFIAGVLRAEERSRFERIIFRSTRGNCFTWFQPIEGGMIDPATGKPQSKLVFIIYYQARSIERKLRTVCQAFEAHTYGIPDPHDRPAVSRLKTDTDSAKRESEQLLSLNRQRIVTELLRVQRKLEGWRWTVLKEKSIFHTLNMFNKDTRSVLHAEGWVIKAATDRVASIIANAHRGVDSTALPSWLAAAPGKWPEPPTHFYTNKYTAAFQGVVDTYGVPRYREANPAMFTAVTFPFMYGVMFGDIGHGSIIFLFGLLLCFNERSLLRKMRQGKLSEIAEMLVPARYMLALMGFFAVYCGFIYNDFFSLGLEIFPSRYPDAPSHLAPNSTWPEGSALPMGSSGIAGAKPGATLMGAATDNPYPFGLDPVWKRASNELLFANSFKMKLAIITGVSQMTFGLLLKASNAIYYKEWVDLWFETLPQIVFLTCIFGYLVFMIFYKWSIDWFAIGHTPPLLVNILMGSALQIGRPLNGTDGTPAPLYAIDDGSVQAGVQLVLVLLAVLMVPLMLCPKPLILRRRARLQAEAKADAEAAAIRAGVAEYKDDGEDDGDKHGGGGGHGGGHGGHGHGEEFNFGEVVIHQVIETIEFVLGAISNTASYLRLWALSLAHTELANVFWEKTMVIALSMGSSLPPAAGVLLLFFGFGAFMGVTTVVLLVMDSLECFLHSLRLHWVEFQSKFYHADGYKFRPFDLPALLTDSKSSSD